MERLGINNELSALKYKDAEQPLREGFPLSKRIDSSKRHFEGVHRRLTDEDHVTHLLWNMHAIYHVSVVFPEKNDLIDYSSVEKARAPSLPRQGYRPTTSLEKIARRAEPASSVPKLDWSEGAIPPPRSVSAALKAYIEAADGAYLKWYPHLAGGEDLRAKLAEYTGAIGENLIVTNGSDDALILICHTFLGPGTSALAPAPTYEHFCANAIGSGAALVRLEQADPFAADPDALAAAIERHRPRLCYLVSPNNPTGVEWPESAVRGLAARFPDVLLVVDEAYHEFGRPEPASGRPASCAALAREAKNVVVTRTFSKAFCLGAMGLGRGAGAAPSAASLSRAAS
jgi:histidinol-phosphate/aromatic aminotransferase/cobyric acid decarboxylase-like protein